MLVKRGTCTRSHASKICTKRVKCNACQKVTELFKTKELLTKCPHCNSQDVTETFEQENSTKNAENRDK